MRRIRCAVLGATGLIGQRFIALLSEHPWFEIAAICASEGSQGRRYSEAVKWRIGPEVPRNVKDMPLMGCTVEELEDLDIELVFSALPSNVMQGFERELVRSGYHVISNSATHRMDPEVPLIVPEVNREHLGLADKDGVVHVTNPNCTTTGLAMVLDPMKDVIDGTVHVSSYQAISGAGYPGISGMDISGTVLPFIEGEEEKIVAETSKILGRMEGGRVVPHPLRIVPNCARVPVRDGHLISISCRLKAPFDREFIMTMLRLKNGLDLPSGPRYPMILREEVDRPRADLDAFAGTVPGMAVTVGRIRVDDGWLRAFLLVNNTIRGGAGNAVLIAEQCLSGGLI